MSKVLALLLIVCITSSNAVFLKKTPKAGFNVFTQLKSFEDITFGKKLLDTIALQLSANSPLGDVARMLAEIRQDLATQQAEADAEHVRQEQECADTIAALDRTIADNTNEKNEAENEIAVLNGQIGQLTAEIGVKSS